MEFSHKVDVEYGAYAKKIYGGGRADVLPPSKSWVSPTVECIKVNSDTSVSEDGWVGFGVVARDHKGVYSLLPRDVLRLAGL